MTLEDFFTLTEMKDGLSTLARVEELVSLMQKQRDCSLNNVGDAAREWSAVAGTLAATENIDCLNHFVSLNGLCFLKDWLQEAGKWSKDFYDGVLEGLVTTLLATLERLPVDRDSLTVSGIGIIVDHLVDHGRINIKEKAKLVSDKWNDVKIDNANRSESENWVCVGNQPKPSAEVNKTENSRCSMNLDGGGNNVVSCEVESTTKESQHSNVSKYSDNCQVDATKDVNICVPDQIMPSERLNLASADAEGEMNSLGTSLVAKSCPENLSVAEYSNCAAVGLASAGTCSSPVCGARDANGQRDVQGLKEAFDCMLDMEMEVNTKEGCPCKSNESETGNLPSDLSNCVPAKKADFEPLLPCNFDSKEAGSCKLKTAEPQATSGDCGMPTCLRTTKELEPDSQLTEVQDISTTENVLVKINGLESSSQGNETASVGDIDESGKSADLEVGVGLDIAIPDDSSKVVGIMNQKPELEFEYEEMDALEVARQVALEVEREVVDYREPFCSSPEASSEEIPGYCSPEGKHDHSVIEEMELDDTSSHSKKEFSDGASYLKDNKLEVPNNNANTNLVENKHISDSSKVTSALGSAGKSDQNICDFDLNEDICTEEFDGTPDSVPSKSVIISAPIAVKGAPSLPIGPLKFEGEVGWKGSAATSAFRRASPRRAPVCEKGSGLKVKSQFLEFDLNVAESEHDVAVDPTPATQIIVSSGVPSGDSSIEVSSRRAERFRLDLNRLGEEDTSMNRLPCWRLQPQNGEQNLSSASSSSSKQPTLRDFDLNDSPYLDMGGSPNIDRLSSKASTTYGSPKLNDSAITIMGARMAVERKDHVSQVHQSFPGNGLSMEAMMAARPALPYDHMPPPYLYNGHAPGPAMSVPPAYYGPGSIPYFDSRGAMVVTQGLGSTGLNVAPSMRPPFFTFNSGAARSGFDLNSGLTSMESGSRGGSLGHPFMMPGHNPFVEEQSRMSAQPSSSGTAATKRKEPECGWEPYSLGYKQVTSWQ